MTSSQDLAIVYDQVNLSVGALAAIDAVSATSKIDSARENGFRVMKTEYWISYDGKTENEGPLMVGLAANHPVAEVEEAIEADPQSKIAASNDRSIRPVWPLEMIAKDEAAADHPQLARKGVVKIKWTVPEGADLIWWVYNMNIAAAITTGMTVFIFAKHYGVWLRD